MAERVELLVKAEQIASLIFDKLEEGGFSTPEPEIYEIILFGSVAEGKENPTDIDLMMFDDGWFSNNFPCLTDKHHMDGLYELLGENLYLLMDQLEVYSDQYQQMLEMLSNVEVDLHILPINFFKSKDFRAEITRKHKDPRFFKNAFRKAMRFNRSKWGFEPLTFKYLEEQFHCSLPDLQ